MRADWPMEAFGEETVYKITVPKGSRAIVENAGEAEVLLDTGARFRVKNHSPERDV